MATGYEKTLEAVGGFGRYQLWVYLALAPSLMVIAGNNGFMTFGRLPPPPEWLSNSTNETYSRMQFYSVAMEWNLTGSLRYIPALMISVQMIGMLFGTILISQMSDRFGRRPAYLVAFVSLLISGVISAFCPNWQSFLAFRFFVGLAIGGSASTNYVWIMEILLPQHRLVVQVGAWPLGYLYGALVAKLVQHWQTTLLILQAPGILALLMMIPIQESPKWLHERGEFTKARKVLQKIAKWNGVNSDEAVKSLLSDYTSEKEEGEHKKKTLSFWHLFYNRQATKTMIVLTVMWFESGCVFFGISFNLGDLAGDVALNVIYVYVARAILQLLLFLADVRFAWLTRRLAHLTSCGLATLCFIYNVIAYSTGIDKQAPWTLTVATIVGISALGAQWCMNSTCTVELSPTLLRSMGYGWCTVMSRIGGIIAPQIFLLFAIFRPGPYLILTTLSIICFLTVLFMLPETKGKPLPDLPEEFEKKIELQSRKA